MELDAPNQRKGGGEEGEKVREECSAGIGMGVDAGGRH